jgi:hypothetical protein
MLGSVKDEKCFSSFAFLKIKLKATLNPHLPLVVGMYSQKLESFSYAVTFDAWIRTTNHYVILAEMIYFLTFLE